MVNTVPVARYFARTTFSTDTGEVKISWSVLFFRSLPILEMINGGKSLEDIFLELTSKEEE